MTYCHPANAKLKDQDLFRDFTEAELDELLELSEPRLFSAGRKIVVQGEMGHSMFLLTEGRARGVLHQPDGLEIEVARFAVGDIFGELALLDRQPRTADVVAVTDCMVMTVTTGLMRMLGESSPRAAFKLAMAVLELAGGRLRVANQRYVDSLNIVSALSAGVTVMTEEQAA